MDIKYRTKVITKMIEDWLKKREKSGGKRTNTPGSLAYEIVEFFREKG